MKKIRIKALLLSLLLLSLGFAAGMVAFARNRSVYWLVAASTE